MSERVHVVDGGLVVRVRPMTPADAPGLRRAWERLSPASRQRRFFGAVTELTEERVRYLTSPDGHDHIALVALAESPDLKRDDGVGVARCIRLPDEPDVAEAAVTVVDDMQGRGIGRLLLESLAEAARAAGITRFRGEALDDNAPVRALLRDLHVKERATGAGTIEFEIDITRGPGAPGSPLRRWVRAVVSTLGGLVGGTSER